MKLEFSSEIYSPREIELMQRKVVLKSSKIHGTGAFARVDIPARQVVGYYKGTIFTGGSDVYVHHWYNGNNRYTPIEVDGPMKFMNHSENPNCDILREDRDPLKRHRSVIISTRAIEEGEELTRYYSAYFANWIKKGQVN